RDFLHGNTTLSQHRRECFVVCELLRGKKERAADFEWRPKELGNGANAFGNEEAVTFARVSALQVSGYTEHAHAIGT
ncbi:MAG TPA: hypothetical protein VH539_20865, partial [Gemmatimonadaceae bacterium]